MADESKEDLEALKKEKAGLEKEVEALKKKLSVELEAKVKFDTDFKSQKVFNLHLHPTISILTNPSKLLINKLQNSERPSPTSIKKSISCLRMRRNWKEIARN